MVRVSINSINKCADCGYPDGACNIAGEISGINEGYEIPDDAEVRTSYTTLFNLIFGGSARIEVRYLIDS